MRSPRRWATIARPKPLAGSRPLAIATAIATLIAWPAAPPTASAHSGRDGEKREAGPSKRAPSEPTDEGERAKDPDEQPPRSRSLVGLFVDTEAGVTRLGLRTFIADDAAKSAQITHARLEGATLGAALGPRLWLFQIGPRVRAGFLDSGTLVSAGGELSFRVPIAVLEPHVGGGFGWATVRDLRATTDTEAVSIVGYYARASAGLDVRATPVLTLGATASYEVLAMAPPGVGPDSLRGIARDALSNPSEAWAGLRRVSGASYGSALGITGVIGLRY